MQPTTIAVLGAGSWGTAVAIHLADCGNPVMLWGHNPQHVLQMREERRNAHYLPSVNFPATLHPEADLNKCLNEASCIIIAVPSHAFHSIFQQLSAKKPAAGIAWLTKGLDPDTNLLFSQLVAKSWGDEYPIAIISGPSFAREAAQGLPTALTLGSNNRPFQKKLQKLLHHHNMRVYLSKDVTGIQLCGAIKNVLAIACGISDGLGYGANAKAALITRGLAEMSRLGKAMGASDDTFIGLAGVGDLVLTCTDDQSRNRRFGLLLGKGVSLSSAEQQIGQVVEGKHNASQVLALARQYAVEMPICTQVQALLLGNLDPDQAVINLMTRSAGEENSSGI